MNRVFQVIYNEHRGKYMVCDETRHLNVKSKSAKLLTVAALLGLSMMSGVASAAGTDTGLDWVNPTGSASYVANPEAGQNINLEATNTTAGEPANSVIINTSASTTGINV